MLKYLHINVTKNNTFNIEGKIKILYKNMVLYIVDINTEKEQVSYNNIVIDVKNLKSLPFSEIKIINETNANIKYENSNKKKKTQEQGEYDKRFNLQLETVKFKEEIYNLYISKRGNQINPDKLIITFGSFSKFDAELRYPISYLGELDKYLDSTLIINFQDSYFVDGTYFLVDDDGKLLTECIKSYIKGYKKKYNLLDNNILFYGVSKGATVAINICSYFTNSTLLLNAPQLKFEEFFKTRIYHYNLVYQYLKIYKVDKYDIVKNLLKVICSSRVYYAYSNIDYASNCGIIEKIEHENLIKIGSNKRHALVGNDKWEIMKEIIINFIKNN